MFVVGGGTSLVGFNFDLLTDEFVFGANLAAIKANADVLVSIDKNFVRNYTPEIIEHVKDKTCIIALSDDLNTIPAIPTAMYFDKVRGSYIDSPEFSISGIHSGWAAFQLAIQSGATEVHLLGFDLCGGEHGKHFFGGYRHGSSPANSMANWWRPFKEYASQIADRGTRVVNWIGEPKSRITCFETKPLEELAWSL